MINAQVGVQNSHLRAPKHGDVGIYTPTYVRFLSGCKKQGGAASPPFLLPAEQPHYSIDQAAADLAYGKGVAQIQKRETCVQPDRSHPAPNGDVVRNRQQAACGDEV